MFIVSLGGISDGPVRLSFHVGPPVGSDSSFSGIQISDKFVFLPIHGCQGEISFLNVAFVYSQSPVARAPAPLAATALPPNQAPPAPPATSACGPADFEARLDVCATDPAALHASTLPPCDKSTHEPCCMPDHSACSPSLNQSVGLPGSLACNQPRPYKSPAADPRPDVATRPACPRFPHRRPMTIDCRVRGILETPEGPLPWLPHREPPPPFSEAFFPSTLGICVRLPPLHRLNP